jgi:hypothetical protein
MAKPYQEGDLWSIRSRKNGQDHYSTGHQTNAAASKAEGRYQTALEQLRQPAGLGPEHTTVAQALQDSAPARLSQFTPDTTAKLLI